jgi:hypothetical protein
VLARSTPPRFPWPTSGAILRRHHSIEQRTALSRIARRRFQDASLGFGHLDRPPASLRGWSPQALSLGQSRCGGSNDDDDDDGRQLVAVGRSLRLRVVAEPASGYRAKPIMIPLAEHMFVEEALGHSYLVQLYAAMSGAASCSIPSPWTAHTNTMAARLEELHGAATKSIVFVTLDPFYYRADMCATLSEFCHKVRARVFAIVHRLPESTEQTERLQLLGRRLQAIMGLSTHMVDALRDLGLSATHYIPHHATHASLLLHGRRTVRSALRIEPWQTAIALIGEYRKGKGHDLLLEALAQLPRSLLRRLFFIFAGKAEPSIQQSFDGIMRDRCLNGICDLRDNSEPDNLAVLSNLEYASYVTATDIGLLLYQEAQRYCASGLLADYVWARRFVIATEKSFVGRSVHDWRLGATLVDETPQSLVRLLQHAAASWPTWTCSASYEQHRQSISPESTLQALRMVLG